MPLSPQTKGSRFSGGQRAPCDSHSACRRLRGGWQQPLLMGDAVWHGHRLRSRPGPSPEAGSGHGAQGPGRGVSSGVPRGRARRGSCPRWVRSVQGRAPEARGARGEGPAQGAGTGRAQDPPPAPSPPRTHLSAGTAVGRVPSAGSFGSFLRSTETLADPTFWGEGEPGASSAITPRCPQHRPPPTGLTVHLPPATPSARTRMSQGLALGNCRMPTRPEGQTGRALR